MSSSTPKQVSAGGDTQPLHKLHRSIVTVYVGPKQYPFHLHKGRLCQHSSFFEGAFHGSFEEATTGSMYLEEDGVEEFILFEDWLYSNQLIDLEESADPSLLLVKLFCLADRVGISNLQNATLDAIRNRATGQYTSLSTPTIADEMPPEPQISFHFSPFVPPFMSDTAIRTPDREKSGVNYLLPATPGAIQYAYQNTPEGSPLRRLLADIFAFNVKAEMLDKGLVVFPVQFLADVLVINMKRLPLRLRDERSDFDISTERYHVHDTPPDRKSRMLQGGSQEEPDRDAAVDSKGDSWAAFEAVKPPSRKAKKKGKRTT